jgi:hypothetical protein
MKIKRFLNDIHIPTRAKYISTYQLLFVLSFAKGCVQLSFEFFSKMIFYPHYLLASSRNIGMHTSTPEYASTADISTTPTSPKSWFSYIGVHNSIPENTSTVSIFTVMTMPFHIKPFEKKGFEEVIFTSYIIKTPKSSRDRA